MLEAITYSKRILCSAVLCLTFAACGDDEPASDGGSQDAGGGKGGGGATQAGAGGSAGGSGRGGAGGAPPAGGTGGMGSMMMTATCIEPAPTGPVVCGGQTCTAPNYMMNTCVVACCAQQGGQEVCGAKSTNSMLPTACEPPVVPDPACPDLDAMGNTLEGCCNAALGKCGIISTIRPGCITQSMLVMLPDPLQSCSAGSDDGGVDDAGL